jgi:hypothetical protein
METILRNTPLALWQVQQVVATDWHDGPVAGVCALALPACTLYFERVAVPVVGATSADNLYSLALLAPDALPRLLAALHVDVAPRSPIWAPQAASLTDALREAFAEELERLIGDAKDLRLLARSVDMTSVSELWRRG